MKNTNFKSLFRFERKSNLSKILLAISALIVTACSQEAATSSLKRSSDLAAGSDVYLNYENTINVFLVVGQSNAVGNGRQWSPSIDAAKTDNVMQWNRFTKKIVHAEERLHHREPTKIQRTGFGYHFGTQFSMSNANAKVLLIPAAEGGSGFDYNGNKNGFWQVNSSTGPDGPGPVTALNAAKEALAASKAANPGKAHVIRAILWHQGENDTISRFPGSSYREALVRLIDYLRTGLAPDGNRIGLVVGGLSPDWLTTGQPLDVQKSLEEIRTFIDGSSFSSASGLKGNPGDIIHFDSASQRTMAARYLQAFNNITWTRAADPTDGPDEISGNEEANTIRGLGGNDTLRGMGGDDFINGNIGDDFVNGNNGNDTLHGGSGNDQVRGGGGNDILSGDTGNDALFGDLGNDTYIYKAGHGSDTITDSGGVDTLNCPDHASAAVMKNRDGNDLVIKFTDGEIRIVNHYAGMPIENINCGAAPVASLPRDFAAGPGGAYASVINGTDNSETFNGGNGNDQIRGLGGNDTIRGLEGDDFLNGNIGADFVNGNNGNDDVRGGSDDDTVKGGGGNDLVHGNDGNDTLYGDTGDDKLFGGSGNDTYIYHNGGGIDIILDTSGNDRIWCPDHAGQTIPKVREGNDLLLVIDGGGIRVLDHYASGKIETIDCGK